MVDSYKEYMVAKKITGKDWAVRVLALLSIVILFCAAVLFMASSVLSTLFILLTVAMAAVAWNIIIPRTNVEYEYLYCDKTITVDAIYGKNSRKTLAEYTLDKVDMICPLKSDRAKDSSYANYVLREYWSYTESEEHEPYAIFYDGKQKIVLDLPRDFVKMIQNNSPRKVFMD